MAGQRKIQPVGIAYGLCAQEQADDAMLLAVAHYKELGGKVRFAHSGPVRPLADMSYEEIHTAFQDESFASVRIKGCQCDVTQGPRSLMVTERRYASGHPDRSVWSLIGDAERGLFALGFRAHETDFSALCRVSTEETGGLGFTVGLNGKPIVPALHRSNLLPTAFVEGEVLALLEAYDLPYRLHRGATTTRLDLFDTQGAAEQLSDGDLATLRQVVDACPAVFSKTRYLKAVRSYATAWDARKAVKDVRDALPSIWSYLE